MNYDEFIKKKMALSMENGFKAENIHPILKPHQRDIVTWALRGGQRAIFASFGLGKSIMQLEICRQVFLKEGGRQLIIAPLGVRQEFKRDAKELIDIEITFVRKSEDVLKNGLYITNYESVRDGKLDVNLFNCVSLDEAAILRSYGSKTFQTFLTLFSSVKYRFVATASPAPNKYKEIIHYAGFLGVMDTGTALTMFFQRDSTKANNLTIHPQHEKAFWLWVSSWAIFLQKPSDLGYSDKGYSLPELKVHYHQVESADIQRVDRKTKQIMLFGDASLSLQDASREKRSSLPARIKKMESIIKSDPDSRYIIWYDQEVERKAVQKSIPTAKAVYGSQDLEIRENRIIGFSDGEFQYLSTKPVLAGSGCNFQRHCHKAIFLGIGFKFADFIQSIHRIYRFLQDKECHIHIIYAQSETRILEILQKKWKQHNTMVEKMTKIIKKYGLSHAEMAEALKTKIGCERIEVKGENYLVANNDCVEETKQMETDSVGLIVTSIPFSNHYQYTNSYNDFGCTQNNDHFWKQMDYLTPELLRILKPGRIYACHVKDRILFGNVTGKGAPTVSPFHMEATFHSMGHGFDYLGMITVVTDVVRENNQTYRLGWTEQCKDGSKMGVGSPEYILLFRKPQTDRSRGYADEPVVKDKEEYSRARWQIDAHAFWKSSGERLLDPDELKSMDMKTFTTLFKQKDNEKIYDYNHHVKIGELMDLHGKLPSTFMCIAPESKDKFVWTDINRMNTLNSNQSRRRLKLHTCPLQFDIVDRLIVRYSNKNDLVFDPFGGLMTVPLRAIKLNRKGRAVELNPESFFDGVKYLNLEENSHKTVSLFDYCNIEEE
jgi:DNA modification methylase